LHFARGLQQLGEVFGWVAQFQHGSKECVGIVLGAGFSQRAFVVDPYVEDDFVFGGKAEEEPIALVEFGSEPVAIVFAEGVSLPEFRGVGIGGNELASELSNCGQEFGGRQVLVSDWVELGCGLHSIDQFLQLVVEEWVGKYGPAVG